MPNPTDAQLIEQWLHGRSPHTQRAYRKDIALLTQPLASYTLADLQKISDSLDGHYSDSSRARIISSIKSLFRFAYREGYLPNNAASALRIPASKDTLAERILSEAEVAAIIGAATNERDKALLVFLYASGGRVSEVCRLKWKDAQADGDTGLFTLYGKRNKTRAVRLNAAAWVLVQSLRKDATREAPVFPSRNHEHGRQKNGQIDSAGGDSGSNDGRERQEVAGGSNQRQAMAGNGKDNRRHLTPSSVWRIVREAAQRAGITRPVSPHWFRHSHATHALEHGAKLPLLSQTLGHAPGSATVMRYLHAKPQDSSSLYLTLFG